MSAAGLCEKCGTVLTPFGAEALCPNCMLREAIGLDADLTAQPQAAEARADHKSAVVNPKVRYFGDYELLEEIAHGGMGVVFRARQVSLNRIVALKMILAGAYASKDFVRRFHAEAEAAAKLQHPNIVAIHEVGEHEGHHYFSMDYVEGQNLAQLVRDKPLPAQRAAAYVKTIAEAIQYAHQQGILHRDLKPSNVLIDQLDQPRVTDFGLAKKLATGSQPSTQHSQLTQTGQVLGTPNYMPPEQAGGKREEIGPHSDVYSIGAILYFVLTARPPFFAETFEETLFQVLNADAPSPCLLNASIPRDLETICLKCLEKDPARRYETANGLARDLLRYLNHEPVAARPPSAVYRFQKLIRRNKLIFTAASAVVAALVIGLGLATWQSIEKSAAYRRAVGAEREQSRLRREAEKLHANETQLRQQAEASANRLAELLGQLQLQRAEELFKMGDSSTALAFLARVLRQNPTNRVAAQRALSALSYRNFAIRSTEPLKHEDYVFSARFSSDGRRVVTASGDKTARIWDAETGRPLTEPLRHQADVVSAQFSPDGKRLMTISHSGHFDGQRVVMVPDEVSTRIWDANTGRALIEPLQHKGPVMAANFSPNGQKVVTTSRDKTARIWDANTGEPLTEPLKHEAEITSAQFNPDGQQVVTASQDKTVRIWDVKTGRLLIEPIRHQAEVTSAQFSPDGKRVVTASRDLTAGIWDATTGRLLTPPLQHAAQVNSARFSPDGQRVATASADKTARIWDATTGKPLAEPLKHEAIVVSAEFSPDGQRLLTASRDNTARIWDANSGRPLTESLNHDALLTSAEFSPDGWQVATASFDKTAQLWDVHTSRALSESLKHEAALTSAQFSPQGHRVVTASCDKTARVWDTKTGRLLIEPLKHEAIVRSGQFSADGERVVTAADDKIARIWDAKTGQLLIELRGHSAGVLSAQFSSVGDRVITASRDKTARIWDARTGLSLVEPLKHEAALTVVQFSGDGQRVLTASRDKSARIWDAKTGQPLSEPLKHEAIVTSAQFSPDGQRVVTGSWDKTARIWDAPMGRPLSEPLRHDAEVSFAQFSPDGQRVVTASHDKSARIWDAKTGQLLTEPLKHEGSVYSAQFSADGQRVLTASWDKTVRIWDANTGQPLTEPLKHDAAVLSAQFSADGQHIVTVSDDKTARLWEALIPPLPVAEWLPKLIEAIGARRFDDRCVLEQGPLADLRALKRELTESSVTNTWTGWAKWFFADRSTRTISPFSFITVPDYVQRRIEENTLESLREAVQLSPTNALALAKLARLILSQSPTENPRRIGEADFLSRRALEMASTDPDVATLRREVAAKLAEEAKTRPKP